MTLLLLGVLGCLAPLTAASPPDPGWIPGLWDNGDYDDVVTLVASTPGVVHAAGFAHLPALDVMRHLVAHPAGRGGDSLLPGRDRTRAPPSVHPPFE